MGLPVPCASPGSEKEQQVARLPSSSVGAHVYVLSTRWEEKCSGGRGGEEEGHISGETHTWEPGHQQGKRSPC